jgi:UTP--glucose-1-phosphate uridylyltransferase
MKPVRKAIFPVAGLGTRFLPATKAIPKEMLTLVDRPLIQYAVEEAREAGIEQFIFVTGRGKGALEDHFDVSFELEATMTSRGKSLDVLQSTRTTHGSVVSVRQQEPLGLGHAVWCARDIIGDEPFAVLLPDEVFIGQPNCLAQLVEAYGQVGGNVVAALEVDPARPTNMASSIPASATAASLRSGPGREAAAGLGPVQSDAAGPLHPAARGDAGARRARKGAGGEIQLTDAMARMIGQQPFHGFTFEGERHDCGSAAGFVIANIALSLKREDIGPAVRAFIADL